MNEFFAWCSGFFLTFVSKIVFQTRVWRHEKVFPFQYLKTKRSEDSLGSTYVYIYSKIVYYRPNKFFSLSLSLFRFLKKKNELEWMNPFVAYRENLMQWWRKISDFVNRTSIEFISRWRGFFTTDIWCWWMFLCLFLFFSFTWALNLGLDIDWQRIFCYPCQLRLFGCHGFYFCLSHIHIIFHHAAVWMIPCTRIYRFDASIPRDFCSNEFK